jgi:hypothetical protein
MSTLNVGAMAARLGLDPSEFLDKMKGVEGFASGSGQRIAAEMKRTSREGAESLRLIDEALGIHLSRPVTRIISQEFPALATSLQSLLGAGVIGAIGVGVAEVGEKIAAAMEKARKAQEAYRDSLDKLKTGFDEIMAGYAKSSAERGLSGLDKKVFTIDSHSLEEARRQLDQLSKDAEDSAKKGAEAGGLWSQALAGIGDAAHVLFNSSASLGLEQTNKQFEDFRKQLDAIAIASAGSPTKGLAEELKAVKEEADKASTSLAAMTALRLSATQEAVSGLMKLGGGVGLIGFSDKEIAAQQAYLDNLKKIQDVLKANAADNAASRGAAAGEDFKGQLEKAVAAVDALGNNINASYAKLSPIANPFVKVEADLDGMRMKADNDFAALAASVANALQLKLSRERLDEFMGYWHQKMSEARKDADLWSAQQALPTMSMAPGASPALPSPTIAPPQLSMAPVRSDLAELLKIQTDSNEAWTKAGQVLQSIETPAEKVQTEIKVLSELLDQGRISQQQYAAAVALTGEQLTKAGLHARELQEQLEKLEKDSTSASSGMKAFLLQIQMTGGENGKFAFDLLSQGLNSFEDNTVKMLEHGRVSWRKYFEDLAAMALKFMETKTISMIASQFAHAPQTPGGEGSGGGGAVGIFSQVSHAALGQAAGPATGTASMSAASTALTTAGTSLSTAAASLSAAAAALNAAAASMSASSAADAGGAAGAAGPIADFAGFFAGGGDVTPGQDFVAGEAGPELIHAGTAGASVTPNSKLGGDSHYYDFRGAVVTDDLMRRAEATQAIQQSEKRMMTAIPTLQREINLRQRSTR